MLELSVKEENVTAQPKRLHFVYDATFNQHFTGNLTEECCLHLFYPADCCLLSCLYTSHNTVQCAVHRLSGATVWLGSRDLWPGSFVIYWRCSYFIVLYSDRILWCK